MSAKCFSRKAEGVACLLLGSESLFLRSGHGQVTMFLWWWWWFSHWVKSDSCGPMDCILPGSSVHGILQARVLEWVAISFFMGPSQPKNQTQVPCTADRFFTDGAMREALSQFSSVPQSHPTFWDPTNHSMPGPLVHHQLPEFTQTHVHWVSDTIQPSHPLSFPSPPAPKPSQHQSLFQWVNSSHEVTRVLEVQL